VNDFKIDFKDTQQVINVGSTVGSVQGDVNINAGKAYTQTASDVLTPQGDINITAQSVDINAATDTYANQQSMEYEQTGITLAISNPVVSAVQTVNQMTQAASQTSDGRMQALAAGTSALAINNAANAVIAGNTPQFDEHGLQVLDANGQDPTENPANQAGGISVSISIGHTEASSSSSQSVNTASGSNLNAGGNINITATGNGTNNPDTGNINVTGSQIKAADNVTLTAQNAINLQAAQNTQTLESDNESSSASLGIGFSLGSQSNGFTINAGLSGSEGNADGNGLTWTETQIQGGNQQGDTVTLNSGTDTNLIGAQVSGNQVIANVGTNPLTGGNLNIQSLQDINTYNSEQSNFGVSVSLCIPPFCTGASGGSFSMGESNIDANYQSVNEQSGIFAGDEGFQVNVNGNTNLTGAVIASTEPAVQNNANSLTTQTLTTSNLENSAEYEAEGYSISAGVGTTQQPDGTGFKNTPTASAGISELSDDINSVTVSGISGGTVNITDNTQQQALTGQDATTTVAMLNRDVQTQLTTTTDEQGNTVTTAIAVDSNGNNLASTLTPIFDQAQVQSELDAQIQITQAFSQVAPKAVGDYASSKLKEAANMFIRANDPNNGLTDEQRLQLINEANDLNAAWKDGGYARVALHAIVGGLTGNLEGAIGAGTSALTISTLGEEIAKLDIPATLKQALLLATATAVGGFAGDMQGAGAALGEAANNYCAHNGCFNRRFSWVDAVDQWRNGQGAKVTGVDASELDLTNATFIKNKDGTYQIHTSMTALGTWAIYGTVTGVLNPDGTMSIKPDLYNFDFKNPLDADSLQDFGRLIKRDAATTVGFVINGPLGTPFQIEFTGTIPAPEGLPK
jgi:filamentous hemagglutinin